VKTITHISFKDGKHEDEHTLIIHAAHLGHYRELHRDHNSDTCSHLNYISQSLIGGHVNKIGRHLAQRLEDRNESILVWF